MIGGCFGGHISAYEKVMGQCNFQGDMLCRLHALYCNVEQEGFGLFYPSNTARPFGYTINQFNQAINKMIKKGIVTIDGIKIQLDYDVLYDALKATGW